MYILPQIEKQHLINIEVKNNETFLIIQVWNLLNNFAFKIPLRYVALEKYYIHIKEEVLKMDFEIIKFDFEDTNKYFNDDDLLENWNSYNKEIHTMEEILKVCNDWNKEL